MIKTDTSSQPGLTFGFTSRKASGKDTAVLDCHSYSKPMAAAGSSSADQGLTLSPRSAGSTPESKKGKLEPGWAEIQENIVRLLSEKIDGYNETIVEKIDASTKSLAALITANSKSIQELTERSDSLFADVEEVKVTVQRVDAASTDHEKRIIELEEQLNNAEAHSRRMNLRLYGLPEMEGENVKKRVLEICAAVVPHTRDWLLPVYVDVCHRVGTRQESRTRPVIIRFSSRDFKDELWRNTSKGSCEYMVSRKLNFGVDLTTKDKEKRNQLWPYVKEAREKNFKAFFVGGKAIIDGKVFRIPK